MKTLINFFLKYLFCWEDGADDGDDGVSGDHPGTGGGSDDAEAGLLAAQRAQEATDKAVLELDDSQLKSLGLDDEQSQALADKKSVKLNDEQNAILKAFNTDEDGKTKDGERPENIPEQFWDAEKKEVKVEALLKSQQDFRTKFEDLKKTGKVKGTVVDKPEDYKFENTDELKEAIGHELEADDPALGLFSNIAHKLGLTQEQYQEGVATFLSGAQEFMPPQISIQDEMKKLGENGDAVMKTVLSWGEQFVENGLWSKDEYEEIIIMGSTATGLSALNKIRQHYTGEKIIPLKEGASGELPSKEELYKAVASAEYENDPVYRKKIDEQFKQVFGTDHTGTSEKGLGVK